MPRLRAVSRIVQVGGCGCQSDFSYEDSSTSPTFTPPDKVQAEGNTLRIRALVPYTPDSAVYPSPGTAPAPRLMDEVRRVLRLKHYSQATEKA